MSQRPVGIVLDVGGEAEDRAGLQHARQLGQRGRRDKAALVVARFGPGIGIEEIGRIERSVRQLDKQLQRIVGEEPDIAETVLVDRFEQLGDAARKDFAADEAGGGIFCRDARQMLAAAGADLKFDACRTLEQRYRIERPVAEFDLERRQGIAIESVLPLMQPLARATAEERPRLAVDVEGMVGLGQRITPPSPPLSAPGPDRSFPS